MFSFNCVLRTNANPRKLKLSSVLHFCARDTESAERTTPQVAAVGGCRNPEQPGTASFASRMRPDFYFRADFLRNFYGY